MFYNFPNVLALCKDLGWVINLPKSELKPKQVFKCVGYQYDIVLGVVSPTIERWQVLNAKINSLLSRTICSAKQFKSLTGLLMATEKWVPSGSFDMRLIQWCLMIYWHVPECLEKQIPLPKFLFQLMETTDVNRRTSFRCFSTPLWSSSGLSPGPTPFYPIYNPS